ncbi:DUF1015 domain-containing protein [candidate division KSB1 bacterium]|nr:DUF1015 domain-containing protein [candidate division KSB1 bacterium]
MIPFHGLRPAESMASRVASHPYDVIDSNEARELAKDNPVSFLHIIKPEIDLDNSISLYDPQVYAKGKENLSTFIQKNILIQDQNPCFYVYKQIMGKHEQTGLVACASVDEYLHNKIKKHEHTRPEKVNDRVNLMNSLNAQTGPIFLAYRQSKEIKEIIDTILTQKPVNDFVSFNDIRHIFYLVSDKTMVDRLLAAFDSIETLYIADGHHRSEGASQYCLKKRNELKSYTGKEEFNYFLSVIFPENELNILPYNRVVKDLNGLSKDQFLIKVNEKFTMEEVKGVFNGPEQKNRFGLYIDGLWYNLTAPKSLANSGNAVDRLDVSILQNNILDPILGIQDPRTDTRITFVGGIRGIKSLESLVNSGEYAAAFSLYPTEMKQVMDVADAGKVMPPKSTWFEPKLLSGLVTHLLD